MTEDIKVFKCKNGHGLGVIQQNSHKVNKLLLYRNAVDMDEKSPVQVDIIAVIESAVDIRCGICEDLRVWAPNQMAFEQLMKRYSVREPA